MQVAVALPFLEPGRAGGGETAAKALVRGLDRLDNAAHISIIGSEPSHKWLLSLGLDRLAVKFVPIGPRLLRLPRGALLAHQALVRGELAKALDQYDVVHFPLLPSVKLRRARTVVTVWDVNHRERQAAYSRLARAYRLVTYDRAARRADQVLVPTRFTMDRVERLLGVRETRLRHVVPGVLEGDSAKDTERARRLLHLAGLTGRFMYYPANWSSHKNHARLFAALREVLARADIALVLSGGPASAVAEAGELARRSCLEGSVIHVGYVDDSVVQGLYELATLLVYPSIYEGFGLPPIEAMARGTVVVASDIPPIREVVGDAAYLVDPMSSRSIADGILATCLDHGLRQRLASAGLLRVQEFSAEAGARRHLDAYRHALAAADGVV